MTPLTLLSFPALTFGLALLIQFVGLIIVLVKMHGNIANTNAELTDVKSELKHIKETRLKELHDKTERLDWESNKQKDDLHELKESMNAVKKTLQELTQTMYMVSDWVKTQKEKKL